MPAEPTPSQTVGPFFAIGLPWDDGPNAATTDDSFVITGAVFDGAGAPIPDAVVETWQTGRDDVRGFARAPTDDHGVYALRTVKPPGSDGQAPHLAVSLFCRGLLDRVVTRIYFDDEPEANAADPVLASVPAVRRETLVARRTDDGYRFDIQLQGDGETVFFAL
jgi:protocatechuate 3,4-dioxygenase, alpha subunit